MTPSEEAQLHLSKAGEFLEAAQANWDRKLYNAATSDAIISAINSKDAICIALTGRTSKSDNHLDAVAELKRAGPAGADLSSTLNRLLKLKTRSQYAPCRLLHLPPTEPRSGHRKCLQALKMPLPAAETVLTPAIARFISAL